MQDASKTNASTSPTSNSQECKPVSANQANQDQLPPIPDKVTPPPSLLDYLNKKACDTPWEKEARDELLKLKMWSAGASLGPVLEQFFAWRRLTQEVAKATALISLMNVRIENKPSDTIKAEAQKKLEQAISSLPVSSGTQRQDASDSQDKTNAKKRAPANPTGTLNPSQVKKRKIELPKKTERDLKPEKLEKAEKPVKVEKPVKSQKAEKPERLEKPAKTERHENAEVPAKSKSKVSLNEPPLSHHKQKAVMLSPDDLRKNSVVSAPHFINPFDRSVLFIMRTFEVTIGRQGATFVPDFDLKKHTQQMTISHKHAVVAFSPDTKSFTLTSMGRNPTKVQDVDCPTATKVPLCHADVIEIGHFKFQFVVPEDLTYDSNGFNNSITKLLLSASNFSATTTPCISGDVVPLNVPLPLVPLAPSVQNKS